MNKQNNSPAVIHGRAYPPLSSHQEEALVTFIQGDTDDDITVVLTSKSDPNTVLANAPLQDIRLEPPLGSAPRQLLFPDNTLFKTHDHSVIAYYFDKDPWQKLHALEKFGPRLIAFVCVCAALCWLLWRYGIDLLVAGAIWLTPVQFVQTIDRSTIASLEITLAEPTQISATRQQEIRNVLGQLQDALPPQAYTAEYRLLFYQIDSLGPNAMALPGGTIIITDELVEKFPDMDVLAGIMAHEIGHINFQHSLRQMYRSAGTYLLITLVAGDVGPILDELLLEGSLLLSLSYSRQHESEADHFGVHLSRDAGFNPAGLITFFDELDSSDAMTIPAWLSTHPSHKNRMEELRRAIAEQN